jgi:3-hydroxymyristoyl/3-hydroxydecanoyl-(acyl carrier protein) dehydratase
MSAPPPIILENLVKKVSDQLELSLLFPREAIFFQGHFENFPILPGVVQLHCAVCSIKKYFQEDFLIRSFEKVKFLKTIIPDQTLFLKLNKNQENLFSFSFETEDGETCSSGKIILECVNHETR